MATKCGEPAQGIVWRKQDSIAVQRRRSAPPAQLAALREHQDYHHRRHTLDGSAFSLDSGMPLMFAPISRSSLRRQSGRGSVHRQLERELEIVQNFVQQTHQVRPARHAVMGPVRISRTSAPKPRTWPGWRPSPLSPRDKRRRARTCCSSRYRPNGPHRQINMMARMNQGAAPAKLSAMGRIEGGGPHVVQHDRCGPPERYMRAPRRRHEHPLARAPVSVGSGCLEVWLSHLPVYPGNGPDSTPGKSLDCLCLRAGELATRHRPRWFARAPRAAGGINAAKN